MALTLLLAAYAGAVLFWIVQSMVLHLPGNEAFLAAMGLHGLCALVLAGAAWKHGERAGPVLLLLALALWPVSSPYAFALLLARLFGVLARGEPVHPAVSDAYSREQIRWLRRGGVGAALSVYAAYIFIRKDWDDGATARFPVWADPLGPKLRDIDILERLLFLVVTLQYLVWLRGSLRLFKACARRPPPLR